VADTKWRAEIPDWPYWDDRWGENAKKELTRANAELNSLRAQLAERDAKIAELEMERDKFRKMAISERALRLEQ
jgi:hypothetical protein